MPRFPQRLLRLIGQEIAVDIVVAILEEDGLAAVAAGGDVVRIIANDDAGIAGHAALCATALREVFAKSAQATTKTQRFVARFRFATIRNT